MRRRGFFEAYVRTGDEKYYKKFDSRLEIAPETERHFWVHHQGSEGEAKGGNRKKYGPLVSFPE